MCLCVWKSVLIFASTAFIVLLVVKKVLNLVFPRVDKHNISGKHVMITGGSSGIGKHVAIEAAKRGAHVTIIARDEKKLLAAVEEIRQAIHNPKFTQFVEYVSVDISKEYENIKDLVQPAIDRCGPVYMLVNCAGMALCGTLEQMSMKDIRTVIDLNLYGTIHVTKALVEGMKQRGRGCIVVTASQAANVGIYGMAAYTSSKFGLKGFAEALYMEVKQSGLTVTLCMPPDTDTPGFENEEKCKPRETSLICQTSGLFSPAVVARQLLEDALKGEYFSTVGLESYLITILTAGMSPIVSIQDTLVQALLMGPLRLVSIYLHWSFDNVIKKCRKSQ